MTNQGLGYLEKTISLNFNHGYLIDKVNVPSKAGIYIVYVGKYNEEKDTVSLHKLIYIGEAKDVKNRLSKHEKWKKWKRYVSEGEILIFSVAGAVSPDRERAECALIYYRKPSTNDECKDEFSYDKTTIKSTGNCKFIKSEFTVERTEKSKTKK